MTVKHDVAVIGAGPGGLAAATTAARAGLTTVLFDEQDGPGGQIYRNIERSPLAERSILGPDYYRGESTVSAFRSSGAEYRPRATVWNVSPDLDIGVSIDGRSRMMRVGHIIVASGAQERPFPIPGWTLPGVMSVGAGQILLKGSGLVPGDPVVLAGTGPLLTLVAWQYLRAGVRVKVVLDTTPGANYWAGIPHLPAALLGGGYIAKGLKMMLALRAGGVSVINGVEGLEAKGTDRLDGVVYRRKGKEHAVSTKYLFLHQGVVPNINLGLSIGCDHVWDKRQLCFRPKLDRWGRSTVEGISIVGDGAGIVGAVAAESQGIVAGLDAAFRLGRLDREERESRAAKPRSVLRRHLCVRPFLDTLYRPADRYRMPQDDTIVCRCEELTAGQVREAVKLGSLEPNRLKFVIRGGMGPCQGRMCGLTVTEIMADARDVGAADVGYYTLRPPIKPLALTELATIEFEDLDS